MESETETLVVKDWSLHDLRNFRVYTDYMSRRRVFCGAIFLFFLVVVDVGGIRSVAMANDEASCKSVRLDQNGGPFQKIPTYDQNKFSQERDQKFAENNISASGQNLCYAVATAELIDAQRFAKGDPLTTITSPISVALNYKANMSSVPAMPFENIGDGMDNDKVMGPGNPMMAAVANNEQKVCDQRWLEGYSAMFLSTGPDETPDLPTGRSVRTFFKGVFDQIEKISQMKNSLDQKEEAINQYFHCRMSTQGSNIADLVAASQAALKFADPIPKAQAFLNNLCKDHSFTVKTSKPSYYNGLEQKPELENKIIALSAQMFGTNVSAETQNKINQQVKDARKKANAEYSQYSSKMKDKIADLLAGSNPKPVGVAFPMSLIDKNSYSSTADHAAVIIGQKWNGKSCSYLLRDSVVGCQAASKYTCDNGSIWIPEDDLLKSGGPTNEAGVGIFWLQ